MIRCPILPKVSFMLKRLIKQYRLFFDSTTYPGNRALTVALLVFVLLILIGLFPAQLYRNWLLSSQKSQVIANLAPYGNAMTTSMNQRFALLEGLRAFTQAYLPEPPSKTEFDAFASGLYATSPGIRNFSIAPDGIQLHVYPLKGNENVPGHNLLEDERPNVRADINRTIDTRQIILSGPYSLRQGGLGIIARQAIFYQDKFWGLTVIVLDVPPILQETGIDAEITTIEMAIRDSNNNTFFGDERIFSSDPIIYEIQLPEGRWTLGAIPRGGWEAANWPAQLIFNISGLTIIILITGLVYLTVNRQKQLELLVKLRTQEIWAINQTLKIELAERKQIENALRQSERENKDLLIQEREQRLIAETLREVTLALSSQTGLTAVLDQILIQANYLVPYSTANITLLEDNQVKMVRWQGHKYAHNESVITNIFQQFEKFPLSAKQLETGLPVLLPDTKEEPHWVYTPETAWIRSHLSIPISHKGEILGLLQLDSEIVNHFSPVHLEWLQPLTNAAAIVIENAHLYEQAVHNANTKTTLLQEVNHRVKNNLATIIGILYAEQRYIPADGKDYYREITANLINRVQGLSAVHNLLSASEWTPLPLKDLSKQIVRAILQTVSSARQVFTNIPDSPIHVTAKQAHYLAQIITELTTNSVKHAHPQNSNPILISVTSSCPPETNMVTLVYRDNGPGYSPEMLPRPKEYKSMGMELIHHLILNNLQGDYTLKNDNGAVITITFQQNPDVQPPAV